MIGQVGVRALEVDDLCIRQPEELFELGSKFDVVGTVHANLIMVRHRLDALDARDVKGYARCEDLLEGVRLGKRLVRAGRYLNID